MQCCNVARISAPRDAARPKNSHLVDPIRGAEARPGVRVPVLWANFGLFGPQRPKACGFSLGVDCRPGAILPRGALMFLAEPGLAAAAAAAAAAGGGGAAALARAPDAAARRWLPAPCRRARYRACVWRRGAAQRAPRARCAAAFCAAHPRCHDWRAGEEVRWAELWYWSTGGILPPQLCLTMLAECLRGPMNDRLGARPLRPPRQVHRRRSLRAHHVR